MNRTILLAMAAIGTGALLAAAACGSDSNGNGGAGATATGTAGGGGGCSCYPCADFLVACATECPPGDPRDLVCPGSLPVMETLNECICDPARGDCADECPVTCSMSLGGGGAGQGGVGQGGQPQCMQCQAGTVVEGGVCKAEFDACAAIRDCS